MKTLQGISGLSLLALLMVGCSSKTDLDKAPAPKPTVNKLAVTPSSVKPSAAANLVPNGLTFSNQPNKISIPQGRVDPFSGLAIAPIKQSVQPTQTAKAQPPTQQVKVQPAKAQPPIQQAKAQPPTQDKKITSNTAKPLFSPIKPTPAQNQAVPPAPPSIEIAQAVQVNGVVELAGKVSAIVKEPGEQSSRSVNAGDYLSKGQVLVKRIEFNGKREPVVILEQNGVEVIKQV
jgi:Tfp pilus assembly protein PilP